MEIIEENVDRNENRGRHAKYPWNKWLQDRKRIRIFYQEDFYILPGSMRAQIHQRAAYRGGKVTTTIGRQGDREYVEVTYYAPVQLTQAEIDADLSDLRPE